MNFIQLLLEFIKWILKERNRRDLIFENSCMEAADDGERYIVETIGNNNYFFIESAFSDSKHSVSWFLLLSFYFSFSFSFFLYYFFTSV
jgi:hypothetical protein